jgi:predicted O-methyltransferase YrrM
VKFPAVFTAAQKEVLADLHERDRQERRDGIRDARSLMSLAPEVAQLLHLLILQKGAKTIVEFGTSHGYSTIHLAAAADRTDGHVYSVDAMPEKTAFAAANLEAAGLSHRVSLATSDGAEFVGALPQGVDFVLVDYGIPEFEPAFAGLRARLAPGCLFFIDGGPEGYWESDAARSFKTLLEDDPSFLVSILPMHKDQLVAVRLTDRSRAPGAPDVEGTHGT